MSGEEEKTVIDVVTSFLERATKGAAELSELIADTMRAKSELAAQEVEDSHRRNEEWKELYAARTLQIEKIAQRLGDYIEHQWHGGAGVLEVNPPPASVG